MLAYVPVGEFDVTFLDGESAIARSNFGAIMELEAEYADIPDDKVAGGTLLAKAAWVYLGRPKDSLEAWAATVHRIAPRENGVSADPSPPTAGDG
jgi:hypothetical protein